MNGHRHSLPGRIRLRFPQLRHDAARLATVTESLKAVAGIISVHSSPYSGGMLIHYEPGRGTAPEFWNDIKAVLHSHQLQHERGARGPQAPTAGSELGRKVVEGLADAFVEKLIQRSAIALVAALF